MLPLHRITVTVLSFGLLLLIAVYNVFSLPQSGLRKHLQSATEQIPHLEPTTSHRHPVNPQSQPKKAKIAKISVVYGETNEYYDGAIATHKRHADRHGYPFYILKNPVAEGYWNKASWLHSLLVNELGKAEDERAEWFMWVDADSAIINPEIPVEIFLPPNDFGDVHFLTNKDQNGLNTGIFFVRVHPWSIRMFIKTLGFPLFRPEVDLGYSADQYAMALIFNETENQPHIIYQPRIWYNTYQFHHGYEGSPGHLLVHFPGLEEDRWNQMNTWLRILSNPSKAAEWSIPVERTFYPAEVEEFWQTVRRSRSLVQLAIRVLENSPGNPALESATEDLRFANAFESDSKALVVEKMNRVEALLRE